MLKSEIYLLVCWNIIENIIMEDEKIYWAINRGPDKISLRELFDVNVTTCAQNIIEIIVTEDEKIHWTMQTMAS